MNVQICAIHRSEYDSMSVNDFRESAFQTLLTKTFTKLHFYEVMPKTLKSDLNIEVIVTVVINNGVT